MPQESAQGSDYEQDLIPIKEWLAKESHLPQDLDDLILKKFLHSCYGSLERTKKCIDRFCTSRSTMTEVYTNRDPCSAKLKTAFDITCVTTYMWENKEIIIHRMDIRNIDDFVFYDMFKSFSLLADQWLVDQDFYPDGHVMISDLTDYSLKLLPKTNIMFFREFLLFLLEGMPVRIKAVHVINYPSYYEKLYALVKPVLPPYIIDVIQFHPDYASLHKAIDKRCLPVEYGGEADSMREQHLSWYRKIQSKRDYYLNDNLWKADLKKKPKAVESAMTGSFKTLSID